MDSLFVHRTLLTVSLLTSCSLSAMEYSEVKINDPNLLSICDSRTQVCTDSTYSSLSLTQANALRFDEPNLPLHFTLQSKRNWNYLKEQTYTILGLSVATVGLMTLLPESITKWDDDARDLSRLGDKWKDNVKAGPVWDRDEHVLNYIMHPYFGGVYYTAARHAGFNEFESFGYSFVMSALFWEYGVEAFAEIPSWQDLFITPMFGAVVGELMLTGEQHILANDGELFGSKGIGNVSLFFLNPVGHIHYWLTDSWSAEVKGQWIMAPWFGDQELMQFAIDAGAPVDNQFIGYQFVLNF